MKHLTVLFVIAILALPSFAQRKLQNQDISLNGFRNPSIGLEYRYHHLSVHAGYYVTALTAGETTKFIKMGLTAWFLPIGQKEIPSSFYAGASYLRGLNRAYEGQNALALEPGFRWMIWKGLNLRIGGIALIAKDQRLRINPTPGISYSFKF